LLHADLVGEFRLGHALRLTDLVKVLHARLMIGSGSLEQTSMRINIRVAY
jgi:hypothetical protein